MFENILLRIEAVNLDQILDDTDRIPIVRGGSFGALFGPRILATNGQGTRLQAGGQNPLVAGRAKPRWPPLTRLVWRLRKRWAPQPISRGASVGLYELKALRIDRDGIVRAVAEALVEDFPHHTFVVDAEPLRSQDDFPRAKEAVIARNRHRQLREPSLALPAEVDDCQCVCNEDDLRPAKRSGRSAQDPVSTSVADRRDLGRKEKVNFLAWASGIEGLDYTQDFEEIAAALPGRDDPAAGKIGVLYLDGNRFGHHQDACRSARNLRAFDQNIGRFRRRFLRRLLRTLRLEPSAFHQRSNKDKDPPGRVLRLELLLWGGDEVLLVLPAWLALPAVELFYRASRNLTWQGQPLTHAGGLVLCHHKTPIERTRRLARLLADEVKERPGGRDRDGFDYLVLESVDFPGATADALARHRADRYGPRAAERLPLRSAADRSALPRLAALRDKRVPPGRPGAEQSLPLGKVRKLAFELTRVTDCRGTASRDQLVRELDGLVPTEGPFASLPALLAEVFPDQEPAWRWLHLIELWDYLGPRSPETAR